MPLYVTEFTGLHASQAGVGSFMSVPEAPKVAGQTVAIGGTSTQSTAFNAATRLVRVHSDAICSIEVGGTNPTATTSSQRMAANQTEFFGVASGDKLAVIANT